MYKIMMVCKDSCQDWEDVREMYRTDDPVRAIEKADLHRDQEHYSWIEFVRAESEPVQTESAQRPPMKYSLSASRGTSGIEGDFPTIVSAAQRLREYGSSFPDDIVEVHITKIP